MPTTFTVKGVGDFDFPDSMSEAEIHAVIRRKFGPASFPSNQPRFDAPGMAPRMPQDDLAHHTIADLLPGAPTAPVAAQGRAAFGQFAETELPTVPDTAEVTAPSTGNVTQDRNGVWKAIDEPSFLSQVGEAAKTPLVEFPAIPPGVVNSIIPAGFRGFVPQEAKEAAGEVASEMATAMTSLEGIGLTAAAVVAPEIAIPLFAGKIGPEMAGASVHQMEQGAREGDTKEVYKGAANALIGGLMVTPVARARAPITARVIDAMATQGRKTTGTFKLKPIEKPPAVPATPPPAIKPGTDQPPEVVLDLAAPDTPGLVPAKPPVEPTPNIPLTPSSTETGAKPNIAANIAPDVPTAAKPEAKPAAPDATPTTVKEPWRMTAEDAVDRAWPPNKNVGEAPKDATATLNGQAATKKNGQWTFEAYSGGKTRITDPRTAARLDHQVLVERAFREGKPVPPEVLADYPDLATSTETKPASATVTPTATTPVAETKALSISDALDLAKRRRAEGKSQLSVARELSDAGLSDGDATGMAAQVFAEAKEMHPAALAQQAVEAWGKHDIEVIEPLRKQVRAAEKEVNEMAWDARRTRPETKAKERITKKAFLQKYDVASMEEANTLYKAKSAAWGDKTKELDAAIEQGKELARLKDLAGKNWSRHTTREKAAAAKAKAEEPPLEQRMGNKADDTQGAIATAGPPLQPAQTAGTPATPIKPISEIIRDLAKGLNIPIRFGRLTTSKFAGYFKEKPNLIGAKFANDMPIVAHEVGHKLDASVYRFSADAVLRPELEALGDPAVAGSRSSWTKSKSAAYKRREGLAEFIRYWLTEPTQAKALAPDTFTKFESILAASEDLSAVMRQAQSDIALWRNAPQEARLDSSISRSDPNGAKYRLPNLTRDLVDDLHFLRLATDDAKISGPLPPSQNPYQLARTLRGSYGMADTFIRRGATDFKTKEVTLGTGLEDALKPVAGRIDEFRRWIVAKRAQELRGQGKETGLIAADVDFVASKYDAQPAFQEAFTKVKAWNDAILKYAADAGLISPESLAAMRQLHQDYVPFHRVFEVGAGESPSQAGGGVGRGLNVGKPGSLKRLTGSRRDIVDPLETMVKNAYSLITAAEKNAINTALADLAPRTDMGRWVEKVATPKEMVKVELERVRQQLEDAGADLSNVPDDLVMSFFKPSGRAPFGENIIKVNRAGKAEFYRLDKELFDTFAALDQDSSSRLLRILSAPAQLLRAGVTSTPDFALFNAMRDTVSAAIISKYTRYPFLNTVRGLGALLNNPKLVSEWAAAGGKQSIEANYFDRAKLQKFLSEKITKDLTTSEQAMVWVKSPLTALRLFTGTLEGATRIGEYQAAVKQLTAEGMPIGDARRQAAFEARDLQDFAKGGAQTKIVRSLAAFWNAALQGNIRLAQAFHQRPFQTTLKGLAFITIPKLLEQVVNWTDEDYWDRPQWERDLFFMIPVGKDANGHTQFLRIPTPFEVGLIFGTVPGRILQSLRESDPKAMEGLPRLMLTQTIPNPTPQSVLTLLEVNAGKGGYSFFRGRPIVPESLKNAPPDMQFTLQNSLTAQKAGKLLGVSPAKIDYVISGLAGGVGKQLTHQVADRAISAATGEKRTAKSTYPGARFVATPAGTQSDAVERFYRALDSVREDRERVKAGQPSKGQEKYSTMLEAAASEMAQLRKSAKEEKDQTKRQAINLQIAAVAKRALAALKGN